MLLLVDHLHLVALTALGEATAEKDPSPTTMRHYAQQLVTCALLAVLLELLVPLVRPPLMESLALHAQQTASVLLESLRLLVHQAILLKAVLEFAQLQPLEPLRLRMGLLRQMLLLVSGHLQDKLILSIVPLGTHALAAFKLLVLLAQFVLKDQPLKLLQMQELTKMLLI